MKTLLYLAAVIAVVLPSAASAGESPIHFDHRLHVEDIGAGCEDCHSGVAESTSLAESLLPGMDTCGGCHDVDDTETCGTCHVDAEEPGGYGPREPVADLFSHAAHVGAMDCSRCHGGAPEFAGAPQKSECRTCHVTAANFEDCSLCHSEGREFVPESHGGMWEYWHGVDAGADDTSCMQCHVQDDCQQCHGGDNVRPRVHPVNFEFNHSIEAKSSRVECGTCHMEAQFCAECHAANFVIPESHSQAGWRNGQVHGPEALFEIESCIACHDAGEAVPASCAGSGCHVGG